MKTVIVVLVGLIALLPVHEGRGAGSVWQQKRVPVYDYTGPAYAGTVERAVGHLNKAIPARGPNLRYKRKPFRPCPVKRREGAVVVCETRHSIVGGRAITRYTRHVMSSAVVQLTTATDLVGHGGTQDPDLLAEEEMIHAVLNRGDGTAHADWSDVARRARKMYKNLRPTHRSESR